MGPGPDQLPEVECRSSHEQIDGIPDRTFEIVLGHSVVMLNFGDNTLALLGGRKRIIGSGAARLNDRN
jgi:hypothetical protein